jgi:hypothetical protein
MKITRSKTVGALTFVALCLLMFNIGQKVAAENQVFCGSECGQQYPCPPDSGSNQNCLDIDAKIQAEQLTPADCHGDGGSTSENQGGHYQECKSTEAPNKTCTQDGAATQTNPCGDSNRMICKWDDVGGCGAVSDPGGPAEIQNCKNGGGGIWPPI